MVREEVRKKISEIHNYIIQAALGYNYLICGKVIIEVLAKQYSSWSAPFLDEFTLALTLSFLAEFYTEAVVHTFLIFIPTSANLG